MVANEPPPTASHCASASVLWSSLLAEVPPTEWVCSLNDWTARLMRVNMDSSIATDPRFRLLARDLGRPLTEIVGALFFCWLACYERRSERLTIREADACAEIDGFAAAIASASLADIEGDEVVFHGVTERIAFLVQQAKRGAKGGRKGKGKPKHRRPIANAKQSQSEATANTLTLTPDLDQSLTRFDFDSVYQQYPRKIGKAPGLAKLKAKVKTQADYDQLVQAVSTMAQAWRGKDLTYCPHFSTFASQARWRDDMLPLPDGCRAPSKPLPPLPGVNLEEP